MPRLIMLNKDYSDADALADVVDYVLRSGIVGGVAVDPEYAVEQMMLVKRLWYQTGGRQVRHFILSFADHEDLPIEDLLDSAYRVALYYGDRFQIVFGLHLDTTHVHLHFAMNTVNYLNGRKYSEGYVEWSQFCNYVQTIFPQWPVELSVSRGEGRSR